MRILHRFYSALAQKDWATMATCYTDDARFSDPIFPDLDAAETRAMWKMLLSSGTDLRFTFRVEEETTGHGRCVCEAFYTFGKTGRPVHNIIHSSFVLRNGLILHQRDRFNFWRWSCQALGSAGWLLGWSPILRNKVQKVMAKRLAQTMR